MEALCADLPFALASIQPEFSPLAIEPLTNGVLDVAMRHNLAVLAWSPLAQGVLGEGNLQEKGGERVQAVRATLDAIALRAGTKRSAIAYAWIMAHPAHPVPLIGSQNPEHIRQAAEAYEVQLTRDEWYHVLVAVRGERMP